MPLDRACHDGGDIRHLGIHPEFRAGDDDGKAAVADWKRLRDSQEIRTEVGKALAIAALDGFTKLGFDRFDADRGIRSELLELYLAVKRVALLR